MHKTAIATVIIAVGVLIIARGDDAVGQIGKTAQPPYVHNVVFYLKKDTPAAKLEAMIADCHSVLGKIASVRGVWAGRPAEKATPDVAVKDYQLGLLVLFDNYEGLKTYLDDPTHLKFVETYTPILEKIQVYDFMNQAK